MRQLRNPVEVQVALGALVSVLMLISIGGLSCYTTSRLVDTERWVAHTHEVIAELESGLSILSEVETKQRGYLLTGDDDYLKESLSAQSKVASWSRAIRLLTADNSNAQHQLDALNALILRRMEMLNERIRSRQQEGLRAPAQEMESLRQGEALTDQIWQAIATMHAGEEQLLLQRRNAAQSSARICQIIIVTGSGLACAIGVGAFLMAQRGLRVQSETRRKLEESRTLMESILDNTPAVVFIKDLAGCYLFVNRRFTEVVGRPREEIIGKTAFDISRRRQAEAADEHFKTVMTTGKAVEVEETVEYPDGLHPHLAVKFPVRDGSGKIWAMAGISADITERKLAEEKMNAANEQLRVSNQELEAFSYSVSHDLRAPLRHIDGFVGLLRKQTMPKLDEKEVRYLNTIAGSARQMGALIDDLLIFSRMNRTEMRRSTISMNSLVDEVIKAMHNEMEGRQINWKIAALPDVEGDFAMLRQVLVNLIGNAVKYTRARNPAEIEMGCDNAPADERIFHIRDNGVGFDMQYVHKLFGVFQRLHRADEFEGTGIGLANVRRIVSRHGGRTWADGTLGGGATFYFSLPKQNNNQKDNHGSIETDTAGRG